MREQRTRNKEARRRRRHPHISPPAIGARVCRMHTALDKPFVGLSDGRIFDPRSGQALDWWGVGEPVIQQAPETNIWQVEFSDCAAVCTPKGIYVVCESQVGQLRVEVPTGERWMYSTHYNSTSRRLRREKQCGRRPVRVPNPNWDGKTRSERWLDCPLLMSVREEPQKWPPPEPRPPFRPDRQTRAERTAQRFRR